MPHELMMVPPAERADASASFPPVLLEEWLREYYFETRIDLSSSGVQVFSVGELCRTLDLDIRELDAVVLDDSPSQGSAGLRQAIADRWGDGDPSCVMATHGSSEAIFLAVQALVQPGDDVVVVEPCYQQLRSTIESAGGRVRPWPIRFGRRFAPDLAEAQALIRPGTRLAVVNFPHNPTGACLTVAEQEALLLAAERAGTYLLWDAAFADLVYDSPALPDPARRYERAISIGTLSKAYGLPGLRVGWCVAAPRLLERFIQLRDYVTLNLSPLVETLATHAVRGADRLLASRLEQGRRNRSLATRWAQAQGGAFEWVEPQGGVCGFPRLPGVQDVERFCRTLAEEDGVLLVPGFCFGHPQHVRLGFGRSTSDLERGLERLGDRLRKV